MIFVTCYILIIFVGQTFSYRKLQSSAMQIMGNGIYWNSDCPGNDLYNFHTSSFMVQLHLNHLKKLIFVVFVIN